MAMMMMMMMMQVYHTKKLQRSNARILSLFKAIRGAELWAGRNV